MLHFPVHPILHSILDAPKGLSIHYFDALHTLHIIILYRCYDVVLLCSIQVKYVSDIGETCLACVSFEFLFYFFGFFLETVTYRNATMLTFIGCLLSISSLDELYIWVFCMQQLWQSFELQTRIHRSGLFIEKEMEVHMEDTSSWLVKLLLERNRRMLYWGFYRFFYFPLHFLDVISDALFSHCMLPNYLICRIQKQNLIMVSS